MTPCTIPHQAPLSMGFSKQEYWSGLPFPSPGYLSDPGIEIPSPALAVRLFTTEPPVKPLYEIQSIKISIYCYVSKTKYYRSTSHQ